MKKILLSLCFIFFSISVWASETMHIQVPVKQKQFNVTLPANPSTGYHWTVQYYDRNVLNLVQGKYIAPNTRLLGAGGKMVYTFSLRPGKSYPENTRMILKYARPWEPAQGSVTNVYVQFSH